MGTLRDKRSLRRALTQSVEVPTNGEWLEILILPNSCWLILAYPGHCASDKDVPLGFQGTGSDSAPPTTEYHTIVTMVHELKNN